MSKKILALGLVLALAAVMVIPVAVSAATSGDTTVSGEVSAVLEVTAPDAITLNSLIGASGDDTGSSSNGSVTCTDANGYTLKINSNRADGKMASGGNELNGVLRVSTTLTTSTGATVTNAALSDVTVTTTSNQTVGTTSAPGVSGSNTFSVSVKQAKQSTAAAGTYSLTLTFTVSANPQ